MPVCIVLSVCIFPKVSCCSFMCVIVVRSITLDKWDARAVSAMTQLGNAQANAFFEANLQGKINEFTEAKQREEFIRSKYVDKKWCRGGDSNVLPPQESVGAMLQQAQARTSSPILNGIFLQPESQGSQKVAAELSNPVNFVSPIVFPIVEEKKKLTRQHNASPWVKNTNDTLDNTAIPVTISAPAAEVNSLDFLVQTSPPATSDHSMFANLKIQENSADPSDIFSSLQISSNGTTDENPIGFDFLDSSVTLQPSESSTIFNFVDANREESSSSAFGFMSVTENEKPSESFSFLSTPQNVNSDPFADFVDSTSTPVPKLDALSASSALNMMYTKQAPILSAYQLKQKQTEEAKMVTAQEPIVTAPINIAPSKKDPFDIFAI